METQARLKSTTMQSWQGVIAEGWHCQRIRKMIIWAGNLFSLNRTLSGPWRWQSLQHITLTDGHLLLLFKLMSSCPTTCMGMALGCLCCPLLIKNRPIVFIIPISWCMIINIALGVYESYHPLVKNISLTRDRSPLTYVAIWYCGEHNWSCAG